MVTNMSWIKISIVRAKLCVKWFVLNHTSVVREGISKTPTQARASARQAKKEYIEEMMATAKKRAAL